MLFRMLERSFRIIVLSLFIIWKANSQGCPGRPPVICGRNEEECPCDKTFCFDRTCGRRSFPALNNGRCKCRNGYYRNLQRECVCAAKCANPAAICPGTRPPLVPGRQPVFPPPPSFPSDRPYLKTESDIILYQLYNAAKQDSMYTRSGAEVKNAQRNYAYGFETAIASIAGSPDDIMVDCPPEFIVPLYRLFRDGGGYDADHFYTTNPEQAAQAEAMRPRYKREGITGYCIARRNACGATWALKRFFSQKAANHFYATDNDLRGGTVGGDYVPEGIECYVWPYVK